jgi:hypothetical protein
LIGRQENAGRRRIAFVEVELMEYQAGLRPFQTDPFDASVISGNGPQAAIDSVSQYLRQNPESERCHAEDSGQDE